MPFWAVHSLSFSTSAGVIAFTLLISAVRMRKYPAAIPANTAGYIHICHYRSTPAATLDTRYG